MDRGLSTFEPLENDMKLKQLAAIQFIKQIESSDKNVNEYFKAENLIGNGQKAEVII